MPEVAKTLTRLRLSRSVILISLVPALGVVMTLAAFDLWQWQRQLLGGDAGATGTLLAPRACIASGAGTVRVVAAVAAASDSYRKPRPKPAATLQAIKGQMATRLQSAFFGKGDLLFPRLKDERMQVGMDHVGGNMGINEPVV